MYGVVPYYFAKTMADLPAFIIVPAAFVAITYFSIGLTNDSTQFLSFILAAIMNTICAVSFSYLLSASIKNPTTALMLAPVLAMPMLLVAGFFGN